MVVTFLIIDPLDRGAWLDFDLLRLELHFLDADFDNLARLREFGGPALILHGRRDEVIPFEHGQRLAASARHGTFVVLDCMHNDCPYRTPELRRWLEPFLRDAGVLR